MPTQLIYRKTPSAGKMASRAWAYNLLTAKQLYGKKHIVIASRSCGDIQYLREIGINAYDIIACDIDKVAVRAAAKYGVFAYHANIEYIVRQMIKRWGDRISSINVDLCNSLINACPVIQKVIALVETAGITPVVFMTYRRGRDGMRDEQERRDYFLERCKRLPNEQFNYQSATKYSRGSPMTTAVFKFVEKSKRGNK